MQKRARLSIVILSLAVVVMLSRFFRDRPPDAEDEARAFRDRVVTILAETHPDVAVTAPEDDPEMLIVGDFRGSLGNLRAKFALTDGDEAVLRELHRRIGEMLAKDYEEMPYPLSPVVFEVTADNEIRPAE